MKTTKIKPIIPSDLGATITVPEELIQEFISTFQPVERADVLHVFVDARTAALYSECHRGFDPSHNCKAPCGAGDLRY